MAHQKSNILRPLRRATLAATGVFALAGCGDDATESETLTYTASLSAFESCEALDDYIVDLTTDMVVANSIYGYGGYAVDMANDRGVPAAEPTADGGSGEESGPGEFTGTNNQERGVDEPDLVKTDGQTMFVVQGNTLHVIDSWPVEETHELATVELPGYGDQMFLVEGQVVVFSHIYTGNEPWYGDYVEGRPAPSPGGAPEPAPDEGPGDPEPDEGGDSDPDSGGEPDRDEEEGGADEEPEHEPDPLDDGVWFSGTRVTVIDVSDPADPAISSVFDVEGNFVNARMVDGVVYLVSRSSLFDIYDPALAEAARDIELPELDWDSSESEREAAAADLRRAIRPILEDYVADRGRDRLIPDIRTTDSDRANLFSCGDLMEPGARAGLGVLSVLAFNPASPTPDGVGLLADGWQLYASNQSLYVAQDSRWWYFADEESTETTTHLHKFALNSGSPVYQASGEVSGWLLDQFSMSEHDGFLRVATTDASRFGFGGGEPVAVGDAVVGTGSTEPGEPGTDVSEPPEAEPSEGGAGSEGSEGGEEKDLIDLREDPTVDANNVFVLEQDGTALSVVGGIRGIAPGEQIFAVRFLGDRGYVVTYRQVDPLFTVDLSTPTAPALRGELHIPGYSGYLHPFGEDHLIGIGRDGTDEGQVLGTQISLFDISDDDNPIRVDNFTLPYGDGTYSWSEAEHDHHAFNFYESHNLLAIPVTLEDYGWEDDTYSHFSGIVVFEVTEEGISEHGRVSHTHMAHDRYCGDIDESDPEPVEACSSWDYAWWTNMRRSVFVDDSLFAISDMGVTASSIDALDEVLAEVRF